MRRRILAPFRTRRPRSLSGTKDVAPMRRTNETNSQKQR
jgi:hypothetical protein